MSDTPVILDDRKIYEIEERSDFDRDQRVRAKDLGDDWGDGFFVKEEPVIVERNRDGSIARLRPFSEIDGILDLGDDAEPVDGGTINTLRPIPLSEREKLVDILTKRLFDWYKSLPLGS